MHVCVPPATESDMYSEHESRVEKYVDRIFSTSYVYKVNLSVLDPGWVGLTLNWMFHSVGPVNSAKLLCTTVLYFPIPHFLPQTDCLLTVRCVNRSRSFLQLLSLLGRRRAKKLIDFREMPHFRQCEATSKLACKPSYWTCGDGHSFNWNGY